MFLSYEYIRHEGSDYDPKTNEYRWRYKIVDSEWEAVGVGVGVDSWAGNAVAVIQEYGKRELPVAANLIRAFQWYSTKYGYSIQRIIKWNLQHNPQYKQFEEEVDKLLVLL